MPMRVRVAWERQSRLVLVVMATAMVVVVQ